MTENKAIQILNNLVIEGGDKSRAKVAIDIAIQALEEIQAYRAIGTVEDIQEVMALCKSLQETVCKYMDIGTVEEFKALKEKNTEKKPIKKLGACYSLAKDGTKEHEIIQACPNCHSIVLKYSYPCRCGQVIDWSE